MLDFARFEACTFDCYGTLIDWETGILEALRPVLRAHEVDMTDGAIVALFGRVEAEIQAEPYRRYAEVLAEVVRRFGAHLDFQPTPDEVQRLPESLPSWRPFLDTVTALRVLKARYRLGILSNVDDALFARSAEHLEVAFDWVITAEQVRSYKPRPGHFTRALEVIPVAHDRFLHVAQSLFHDIVPARELGWTTVWVNRPGSVVGVTPDHRAQARPDVTVPDLATLASLAAA